MISLYADGQERLFPTNATTVSGVLARSGVTLGSHDLVEPSASTKLTSGQFNINVYRAREVRVVDGDKTYEVDSAYQSGPLLAQAAGLTVYPEDQYQTQIITNIVQAGTIGEQVTIIRAKPMSIQVDGGTVNLRTQSTTVGDALKQADIALGVKDTVSVPVSSPVVAGMNVDITRVSEADVTLTTVLPKTVQTITDPNVMLGQSTVETPGSDGQETIVYLIHYTNGVETARTQLQVVSQTPPVTEVIHAGSKVLFAGSVEYWRPMVEAAAAQWGIDPNKMLRIMACESRGNATDVSQFVINGQNPTGLFQYLPTTWATADARYGSGTDSIMDGAAQVKITAAKMATEGYAAWECQ
jgi:uncharacterized protein YabE (DUF348 family)